MEHEGLTNSAPSTPSIINTKLDLERITEEAISRRNEIDQLIQKVVVGNISNIMSCGLDIIDVASYLMYGLASLFEGMKMYDQRSNNSKSERDGD